MRKCNRAQTPVIFIKSYDVVKTYPISKLVNRGSLSRGITLSLAQGMPISAKTVVINLGEGFNRFFTIFYCHPSPFEYG